MTCPSQTSRLNHPDYKGEVPHSGAFSNPHFSLNVRDHVSQPYSTTGNIIVLYILIFKFLGKSQEDKSVWTE